MTFNQREMPRTEADQNFVKEELNDPKDWNNKSAVS